MEATPDTLVRIRPDVEAPTRAEPARPPHAGGAPPRPPRARRPRLVLFGLVWATLAVGFTLTWAAGRVGGPAREEGEQAPVAAATPTEGPDADADAGAGAGAGAASPAGPAPAQAQPVPRTVTVALVAARDDVWVQAHVDGAPAHESVVRRGDRLDFAGDAVDLVVSKPAAVDVSVDGVPVPPTAQMHLGT